MEKFNFILKYLDEMIKEDGVFNSEKDFKYLMKNIAKKYTRYKEKTLLLENKNGNS